MSVGCVNRQTCRKCNKYHPTILHIDGFRHVDESSGCKALQSQPSAPSPPIILPWSKVSPVLLQLVTTLKSSLGSFQSMCIRREAGKTYCFYHNSSTGCFISEKLFNQLGARGVSTHLQLKTMHGASSVVVDNLVVTDVNEQNGVELPKVYTRGEIPASTQQIAMSAIGKQWNTCDALKFLLWI